MTTREALYRLVDSIPETQLDDARKALEPLADPVLVALANAPYDDEPETDEEREAVAEGRAALDAGDFVTMEGCAASSALESFSPMAVSRTGRYSRRRS